MASTITKVIKKVMPAVVSISISKSLEQIEKEIPSEVLPFLPFQKPEIPPELIDAHGMVKVGGGSGFIVKSDGTILTNKHVVVDPHAEYTVITNDQKKYKATVLARDPVDDVAIIKIEGKNLSTVSLGSSAGMELGEDVLAIGTALGIFPNTVSSGIVSGLARSIRAAANPREGAQELRGLIQTDAAINPGNSGGPLVNMRGEAIGINTAIVFGAQNLSFAIPIDYAKRDLEDITTHGRIRRPLLGLRYMTIDENLKEKMRLPADHGAWVVGHLPQAPAVVEGSPAEKAGIKEKDVIVEWEGQKLTTERTVQDCLEEMSAGDTATLKILREGKAMEVKVTLSERKLQG